MNSDGTIVDLRSDTVTKPTSAMREAMMRAAVGDDVLGDDPTVLALQRKVAELLGKEDALFFPSGTMANQVAVRAHTQAGDEIILEATGHTFLYETGALGALCGVQANLIEGHRGIMTAAQVRSRIRPDQTYVPQTRLVVLENTHNHGGGTVYPIDEICAIREICQDRAIPMHLDGARLWNASVATGISAHAYAAPFDSVSVCFSKGLGAPVGSALTGSKTWIDRARRFRKMFGGGMRQAGILAAAAIHALDHHLPDLAKDHARAKSLAARLSEIPGVIVDPSKVETNILFFGVEGRSSAWLAHELESKGVRLFPLREQEVRAVFHREITDAHVDRVVDIMKGLA